MSKKITEPDAFVLLANRRRRLLLWTLHESETSLRVGEVTERIGEREFENPTVNDYRDIHLSLFHNHLPRLEEAGVIVYDKDEGTVVPDLNFRTLVRMLEDVDECDLPWSGSGD